MKSLVSLCSTPPAVVRDGYTGPNAKVLVPFLGYWWAAGVTVTFPGAVAPQAPGKTISGTSQIDTFQKDCCSCSGGCS